MDNSVSRKLVSFLFSTYFNKINYLDVVKITFSINMASILMSTDNNPNTHKTYTKISSIRLLSQFKIPR